MSEWLLVSRRDIPAIIICAALVAGIGWFAWMALPNRDRPAKGMDATVLFIRHQFPASRNGSQGSVSIRLRADDGAEIGISRSMRCQPAVKVGDRVRLTGVHRKAGGAIWSMVGEPCPQ